MRLRDILRAITGIQETVASQGFDTYSTSWSIKHASERGIEIISEASRHVPDALKGTEPEIPWRQIADVGNVLRHGYQTISDGIVWDIITTHLEPLKAAVRRMLERLERSTDRPERNT